MRERRQYERFPLTLPTRIETTVSDKKQVFEVETRDVSASGAFIYISDVPFSESTFFKVYLTVPSGRIKALTGARGLIACEGNIVRHTHTGVGIRFNGECQIISLKGL